MIGKASSPNYNSVGGRQAFVRYVAVRSDGSGAKPFVERDESNRVSRLYRRPVRLRYRCGFREYTFTDDGNLLVRGIDANAGDTDEATSARGIEALEVAAFLAGGREALLLPSAFRNTKSFVQAPGTSAAKIARGVAVLAGIASGFTIGYIIGYDDTISCVDAELATELADKTFWEAALNTYRSQSPMAFDAFCWPQGAWEFSYGRIEDMVARHLSRSAFDRPYRLNGFDEKSQAWSASIHSGEVWILDEFSSAGFVLAVDPGCERSVSTLVRDLEEAGESGVADVIMRRIQFQQPFITR